MVALELARAGRRCVLLEARTAPHHKVCGEFISSEAIHYLMQHSIDVYSLGAVALETVRLVLPSAVVERKLPFPACSLTRMRLDEEMLQHAMLSGADIQRGNRVEELTKSDGLWCVRVRDGRSLGAADVFLATGKHDLRGWARPEGTHRGLVAFKQYYRLTPQQHQELGNAAELFPFQGGYAGLQPVECSRVNLCLVIHSTYFKKLGSNWDGLLSSLVRQFPHLERRLDGADALLERPLAASHIPYGHLQGSSIQEMWPVGDQAAVIPSFCGDGMAIALHSGAAAAQHFLSGRSPESYQRQLRRQLGNRLALATSLSQLMVACPRAAEIVRVFPAMLSGIAGMTRIPDRALRGALPSTA